MKGRKLAGIVVVIYVLILTVCSASWLWGLSFSDVTAAITHSVVFEAGSFSPKESLTELKVVLQEGETAKLDELPALKKADLRGSDCTAEICEWARAHPGVDVIYDVPLLDGTRVDYTAEAVDFSAAGHATLPDFLSCLDYLPNVTAVSLGTDEGNADPLTPEDISTLAVGREGISFSYSVKVGALSISLTDTTLDLTSLKSGDVEELSLWLPHMTALSSVALGDEESCTLSWAEIAALEKACPQAQFSYSFTLYGRSFTLADETIDLSMIQIDDDGAAVVEALPALTNCKTLDMDDGGVVIGLSYERMQSIREQFPEVDVVWRIWFGTNYSVRTDTERILASKPTVGGNLDDVEVSKLRYCTKVKYIDLGHNESIYDISFVSSMPDLEVFIIAMNPLMDISPLKNCTKLEYLEIFSTYVSDLSPLSGCTALRHLNISNCPNLTDISPLYGLSALERLWIGTKTTIPADQIAQMQSSAPACKISNTSDDEQGDAWRYTHYDENKCKYYWVPRYEQLAQQLGYFTPYKSYSFYWLDTKCARPAPEEFACEYYLD